MIKRLKVEGLNEKINLDLTFNSDLNILTGKNGSGKTTLLKLIWYSISGNIERIIREISFDSILVELDGVTITVFKITEEIDERRTSINYNFSIHTESETILETLNHNEVDSPHSLDTVNSAIASATGSSLFFPTFRRVEGGIVVSEYESRYMNGTSLEQSMYHLANRISVFDHKFVSSISTNDIISLITERYANASESTNQLHNYLSNSITKMIRDYKERNDENSISNSDSVLQAIESRVDDVSLESELLLKPFSLLSEIVNQVFKKPIQITKNIILGEGKNAILSDKLSAGEKQMLSFFCYNAFYKKSPIFIDEPELSLHTDWQRTLFPNLLKQDTGNQFIIATHSPFIYSKYPDKELSLNSDRGE
ncbi:MAG: AAA family ATPase [Janthinobacterium lividum]